MNRFPCLLRPRSFAATLLLTTGLGLAGCAGDGNSSPAPTATVTVTVTATSSPTASPSPTQSSTRTAIPTNTSTATPSSTSSTTATSTATASATSTPTITVSPTQTFVPGSCADPAVSGTEPLCALDSAAFTCEFLVPGYCMLPYPSSAFLVNDSTTATGVRVHYPLQAMPANIRDKHIDPSEYNTFDGFSPGPVLVTLFPQGVDLEASQVPPHTNLARSLEDDCPTVLLDAASGERVAHFAELDTQSTRDEVRSFLLRPAARLQEGHRYIVAIRGLIDRQGLPIQAERPFTILRDRLDTPVQTIEARRPQFEDLFQRLSNAGVARQDLIIAWDFTVASSASLTGRALSVRDQGLAINGPGAPPFTVTSVEENVNDKILRRVQGTFRVPLFMTTSTPLGVFHLDENGVPAQNGFMDANFLVNIPRSAVADGVAHPARISVYGHGLFGSRREVNAGHLQDFSNQYNIMFGGTEWIGMSEGDPEAVTTWIKDLSFFPRIADRLQQAMLNFILLGRLFLADDGFASDPNFQLDGVSLLDRQELYYYGISQGGIEGGVYLSLSPDIKRGVMGVGAANYSTLLQRSVDFVPFQFLLNQWYQNEVDRTLLYPLLQQLWDRGEPNGYIAHLVSDPLPNTPVKKVLMQIGLDDAQVSNLGSTYEARTLGIPTLEPSAVPAFGIPELAAPFDGSAYVPYAVGGFAMPLINQPPIDDNGVHEAVRRLPAARQQIDAFLRPDGKIENFCPGACAFTDVPNVDEVEPTPTPAGQ